MTSVIKLKPKLFDIFQHCELKCHADCCGWDAFDLSKHWLTRWCDSRDAPTIQSARQEIREIREKLAGGDPESKITIEKFFAPILNVLEKNLMTIDNVLASHDFDSDLP